MAQTRHEVVRLIVDRSSRANGRVAAGRVFVGRDRELDEIARGVDETLDGRGALFLVTGEPGIGKTRLVEEASRRAQERGALVVWGRCWEGPGAPAFLPWTQALREYLEFGDLDRSRDALGSLAPFVAQIVPELAQTLGPLNEPEPVPLDSDHARFYLFDSVTSFLARASRETPLVMVIDDLHEADRSSVMLLAYLARHLSRMRVLVIATSREPMRDPDVERASSVRELVRFATPVALRGLSLLESGELATAIMGTQLEASTLSGVFELTEGNPFFIDEVVRLLAVEGDDRVRHIPGSVRETIHRRLAPMSDEARDVLGVAAVAGREFGIQTIQAVCASTGGDVLSSLGSAIDLGLVRATGAIGRYEFTHAVVRQSLYDALGSSRRLNLHAQVGRALEDARQTGVHVDEAELAHHFCEAALAGEAERAIAYSQQAGERALARLGYEEAAGHFARALQVLSLGEQPVTDDRRGELLNALGEARRRAGDIPGSREVYVVAAEAAKARGDAEALARAALGYGAIWTEIGSADRVLVGLLEDAVRMLEGGDERLRSVVLARLAAAIYWSRHGERREELAHEAIAMARRTGDAATLARVLHRSHWALWSPDNVDQRLEMATEIVGLALEARDRETELEGRMWRITALLELAEIGAADAEIDAYARVADRLRQPYFLRYVAQFAAMRATMDGRLDDAERHVGETLALGQESRDPNAMSFFGVQLATLRREQGRMGELEPLMRGYAARLGDSAPAAAALGQLYAAEGRSTEASEHFERLARDRFSAIRRDATWVPILSMLTDVCVFLGDEHRAPVLYDLLLPYESHNVVVGHGLACYGAASRFLGLLAALSSRPDDARSHFENALVANERMRASPLIAHTCLDFAKALAEERAGSDDVLARELSTRAAGLYEQCGMDSFARVAKDASDRVSASAPAVSRQALSGLFRRDGDAWQVGLFGRTASVRDAKGMRYLHLLLSAPDREVHATALAAHGEGTSGAGSPDADELHVEAMAGTEIMDAEARAALRRRLQDLREDLRDAETFADAERASRAKVEMDAIASELARSVGRGGRARRTSSAAERARINVTRSIRSAVQRIAEQDAALGHHLDTCVRTGAYCSYTPDPSRPISWQT